MSRLPDEIADADCVQRMAAGDAGALRRLYHAHVGRVWGFARRLLGDDQEAEEVTQDVFVRAWRKAREYDHERASPWAWLAMMTRSICLDRLRRRRRQPDLMGATPLDQAGDQPDPIMPARSASAVTDVSALMQVVRPVERTCLTHVYLHGLTLAETAALTGLPLGSVKTHVRRALQRVRENLSGHDS